MILKFPSIKIFFLFFLLTLPFFPAISIVPGTDIHSSRIFTFFLVLFWGVQKLFQKEPIFPRGAEAILLSTFFFLSGFSLFFAENIEWGLRKIFFLFNFFLLFPVAVSLFQKKLFREKAILWMIVGSAISAMVGILQVIVALFIGLDSVRIFWQEKIISFFSGSFSAERIEEYSSVAVQIDGSNFLRASATFPDPHIASIFWGMTFPLALAFTWCTRGWKRVLFGGMTGIILLANILTFSRGGLVAIAVIGGGVIVGMLFRMSRRSFAGALAGILLLGIFFIVPGPVSNRFQSSWDMSDNSTSGRLSIWMETVEIIRKQPLMGVGIGNYSNTVKPSAEYREPRYAHNIFLDIAAESGCIAAGVFLALLFFAVRRAICSEQTLPLAVAASLGIFVTHSLFETPLYSVQILPCFIVLLAYTLSLKNETKNDFIKEIHSKKSEKA